MRARQPVSSCYCRTAARGWHGQEHFLPFVRTDPQSCSATAGPKQEKRRRGAGSGFLARSNEPNHHTRPTLANRLRGLPPDRLEFRTAGRHHRGARRVRALVCLRQFPEFCARRQHSHVLSPVDPSGAMMARNGAAGRTHFTHGRLGWQSARIPAGFDLPTRGQRKRRSGAGTSVPARPSGSNRPSRTRWG